MSLSEIAASLQTVLADVAQVRARLAVGIASAVGARDRVAALAAGSHRTTLEQATKRLEVGIRALEHADGLAASAATDVTDYARSIGIGIATAPAASPGSTPRPAIGSRLDEHLRGGEPSYPVRRTGRGLPVRQGGKGPTHGRVLDAAGEPVGEGPIRSREDRSLVDDLDLDEQQRRSASLLSHVEAHVAAAMRRGVAPREAMLVLNNRVCRGPLSCDALLSGIMPSGARLAVFVTDGERTWLHKVYHGTGERIRR